MTNDIPAEELSELQPMTGGDYWVLQNPAGQMVVGKRPDFEGEALIAFKTEAEALLFKDTYGVGDEFAPTYVPPRH